MVESLDLAGVNGKSSASRKKSVPRKSAKSGTKGASDTDTLQAPAASRYNEVVLYARKQ